MDKPDMFDIDISDISSTMLLTFYCRVKESQPPDPMINDPEAIKMAETLKGQLASSRLRMYRDLAAGKIKTQLAVFITLRALRFDRYTRDFLKDNPGGTVINMGCGLDTRFWRTDNGSMNYFDIDLPEVIAIKKKLVSETRRYHLIGSSVLDYGWMQQLKQQSSGPYLFLAEGLLMYLEKEAVKAMVAGLRQEFPGSQLACEVVHMSMASGWLKKLGELRMQAASHVGRGVTFTFGVKDGHEMESWAPGVKLLDEWSYFDDNEPRLGWTRIYGKIPSMRKKQWVVNYRLG